MLCHGNGNDGTGCCFIRGLVCPLRWRLDDGVNGHIYDSDDTDLGTVVDFVEATIPNRPGRQKAYAQLEGTKFVCRAAIEVLVEDAKLVNDRPGFEAAWMAHPDYVSLVAPEWRAMEAERGLPALSLDCATWKGKGEQCCFAQTQEENDASAAGLSADGRTVREAGGV